jgi:hypothetical protein
MSDDTAQGTFACPICGKETPHGHDPMVVRAYEETRRKPQSHPADDTARARQAYSIWAKENIGTCLTVGERAFGFNAWLAAWTSRAPAQDERADAIAEGRRQGLEEAAKWHDECQTASVMDGIHGACAVAIRALIDAETAQYRAAVDGLNSITDREIADREGAR